MDLEDRAMNKQKGDIASARVHRLAVHRGDPVISSLYLDVDGAHRPVAATYEQAFSAAMTAASVLCSSNDDRALGLLPIIDGLVCSAAPDVPTPKAPLLSLARTLISNGHWPRILSKSPGRGLGTSKPAMSGQHC
jgi:hypothetical protein